MTCGVVEFGLADAPMVQVQILTHVGEVGRGHKHVVLCPQYILLYDQVKVS